MLDDAQIIEGCIKNNQQCRGMLYEKYAPSLYAVALRYTATEENAQDVLHDAFLKIFDNIKQFGEKKGTFVGWLTRIVVNQALTQYKLKPRAIVENYDEYEESIPDTSVIQSDKLTHKILLGFIKELPQGFQMVFNLCEIEGYSYEEAAKMLNCTASNCRSQLFRAKTLLRTKVNDFMKRENR